MRAWMIAGLALCLAACNRPGEQSPAFAIAHGAGPVERIECRQGECYWTQRQSVTVLSRRDDAVLLKVAERGGNSVHGPDAAPPDAWAPGIDIAWQAETVYFRCSRTRPAMLWKSDGAFLLDALDLHGLPGAQVASASEYMSACHSLAPGKWDGKALQQLGYAKAAANQAHYPTLEAGLKALAE